MSLSNTTEVIALSPREGAGGDIVMAATSAITILGPSENTFFSDITLVETRAGNDSTGGTIYISAPFVTLQDRVAIRATGLRAPPGEIRVSVGVLRLSGGAMIGGTAFSSVINGAITVTATDAIMISGTDENFLQSPSSLSGVTHSSQDGSPVTISASLVHLTDGGAIITNNVSSRRGGDVRLNVDRLIVTAGGRINTSRTSGQGGSILVTAVEQVGIPSHHGPVLARLRGSEQGVHRRR